MRKAFLPLLCLSPISLFAATPSTTVTGHLDLYKVFQGAPIIYTLLIILSVFASVLWLYTILTFKAEQLLPSNFFTQIQKLIAQKDFELAYQTCKENPSFSSQIMKEALEVRGQGREVIFDTIQSEAKRHAALLWQRISMLNDIATVAPMFGLLGTVIGMFFAFYDTSQSAESLANIFDGLGVAVGTTVVGLLVAIVSMVFYTTLKYRVVKLLTQVENKILSLAAQLYTHSS